MIYSFKGHEIDLVYNPMKNKFTAYVDNDLEPKDVLPHEVRDILTNGVPVQQVHATF